MQREPASCAQLGAGSPQLVQLLFVAFAEFIRSAPSLLSPTNDMKG